MISARVHNFRGCARAEIALDPIALVAGRNGAGKSSLAQAVAAALTGETIAAGLATKATASILVTTGATQGFVEIGNDDGGARVDWPACTFTTKGEPPHASRYAAGLASVATMPAKERAQVLAGYLHADPTREDLAAEMTDKELGAAEIVAAVWALIERQGWDGAHQERRDKGVELKARWRQIAHQNWGSRMGVAWRPPDWTLNLDGAEENDLLADIARAKQAHEAAIGAAAVSAARYQEMTAEAAELDTRKDALRDAEAEAETAARAFDEAQAQRETLPPAHADTGMPCPHCGAFVVLRRINVAESRLEPAQVVPAGELKARRRAIAEADGAVGRLQGQANDATRTVEVARARMQQAAEAANKLKMFPVVSAAGDDVDKAKAALEAAKKRLQAWRQVREASDAHEKIVSNERLLAILAPDGLRAQKLARVVDLFNRTLAGYCEAADWSPVTVAGDMAIAYGGRAYALLSTSEQYRVRAVLQVAMAKLDQSAMAVFDAADVLDGPTRSGLFAMLDEAGLPALVCMTATRREQVPDLEAAGLGQSYWIERGVAHVLKQAAEAA